MIHEDLEKHRAALEEYYGAAMSKTTWERGMPVTVYTRAPGDKGVWCVSCEVPGSQFICALCGTRQVIHDGNCSGCRAEIDLHVHIEEWRRFIRERWNAALDGIAREYRHRSAP